MYAVFVIAAILLSAAPMHAHALLATVMPNGVLAHQIEPVSPDTRRSLPLAARPAPRTTPVPLHLASRAHVISAPQPSASLVPIVSTASPLAHTPNAP